MPEALASMRFRLKPRALVSTELINGGRQQINEVEHRLGAFAPPQVQGHEVQGIDQHQEG